jgi:arginine/serine-rich splicing factor 2
MSSSPSSRRKRSTELSQRKNSVKEKQNENKNSDKEYFEDKEDGSEFNTRGHGPPKIEGMVSLKVDNITQRTGVNLLKKVFGKFGDLGDIYVPRYPDTFASRGFAFVRYYRKRDAEDAMHAMNGERLDGRILSIQMARYSRPSSKSSDKHLSSKRSHYHHSDYRRNGVIRSYRRSDYSDRSFSRRKRSRSRSRFLFLIFSNISLPLINKITFFLLEKEENRIQDTDVVVVEVVAEAEAKVAVLKRERVEAVVELEVGVVVAAKVGIVLRVCLKKKRKTIAIVRKTLI